MKVMVTARHGMPPSGIPTATPEVELDFELLPVGEAFMDGLLAKLNYQVLRLGIFKTKFQAEGLDTTSFTADKDTKYLQVQQDIITSENEAVTAASIVA